ncbi:MAG: DegT/DnrJ/EryC1/StrS family aminotransferase [Synergistaceae bacterium]|jgi:pyridoxal phosphate-dependent aminotransferase EpsN|nr:DegT/DnrJ/EryC1/StrS family aminotransferase [Synergistaceae bacterium]
MSGDEIKLVSDAFASNWIAPLGPHVEAFERETAEYVGRPCSALALASGTAALHLAFELLGVGRGDVVVCASLTFAATVAPAYHKGAEFVFIDSEPESWNMSPRALDAALSDLASEGRGDRVKAVVAVDLYGQTCDMDSILAVCDRHGVPVIEDAAESLGSLYKGVRAGGFGKFSVLSYNGNKIITTSGGGMLLSDADSIKRARFLSTQARDPAPWYQHSTLGWNYRLSNILAAIGRGQMMHIQERIEARRRVFDRYAAELGSLDGVNFMPEPEWSHSNRWLTALTIDREGVSPVDVVARLEERNIEARPVWKPMHMQPVFDGARYYAHDGDVSRRLFERGLCLPSGSAMTQEQQGAVISAVKDALR